LPADAGGNFYGRPGDHPDGAIYPGSKHGLNGMANDGTAYTFLLAETTEQEEAVWSVGDMMGMYAVFESDTTMDYGTHAYPSVAGFTPNRYWERTTIATSDNVLYQRNSTTLSYDDSAATGQATTATRGPDSDHTAVVNHLLGDGSVKSVLNEIDVAAYMANVTRNGRADRGPLDP
jgi:hypothetical protein